MSEFGAPGFGPGFYAPGMAGGGGGGGGGGGDVTAASNLAVGAIVIGADGVKGVESSGVFIDASDNVSGALTIQADTIIAGEESATTGTVSFKIAGGTGGVTVQAPDLLGSGSYNLVWPTTAGDGGQSLLSGGIGGQMTWGSPPTSFDATVGATGADYTTISAALAASKTSLLAIDNVTETSACAVPAEGLAIFIMKGVNVDMGANQFTFAGAYPITIDGQDPSSRLTFAFTAAPNTDLIEGNTLSVVSLSNLTIDNNSTQSGCRPFDSGVIADLENIWYEPPNVATCGIYLNDVLSRATDIWITAPGTTATDVLRVDSGIVRNLRLSGAFTNSNDAVTIGSEGVLDGVNNNGNVKIATSNDAKLSNVFQGGGTLNLDVDGDNAQISNVYISAGTTTITSGQDTNKFVNCELATLVMTGGNRNQFDNCEIGAAFTLAGALGTQFCNVVFGSTVQVSTGGYNQFSNCRVASSLTIDSGAVRNMFTGCSVVGAVSISDQTMMTGCKVGADAGGGANTITIAAGTGTSIVGCLTDAAISDSGTTTTLVGNTVY
jgi:hypothetical protein